MARWGIPLVDLFVSVRNAKVPRFFSCPHGEPTGTSCFDVKSGTSCWLPAFRSDPWDAPEDKTILVLGHFDCASFAKTGMVLSADNPNKHWISRGREKFLDMTLALDPLVVRFFKAMKMLVKVLSVPLWDLQLVLDGLSTGPFGPLADAGSRMLILMFS